jgi:hypothetical protein
VRGLPALRCFTAFSQNGERNGEEKEVFRNPTGRTGLRALAATVGVAGTLLALGSTAAQASTAHASPGQARTHLVRVTPAAPRQGASPATAPYPSNCSSHDATCTYNSGWQTYNDGGCQEQTIATWEVLVNTLDVTVNVESPYLFASCTAYATVYFGANSGPPYSVGPYYGFACAELDPSCSSNQSRTYQTLNAVPASQLSNVNSMWTSTAS